MLHRLITDRKLAEVEPDHLGLDLDLVEFLAAVNPDHGPDHLRHDDHVPQMRLHQVGLLVRLRFLLRLAQLFDQPHRFAFQAPVEAAPRARVHHVPQLFRGQVQQSVGFWERRVRERLEIQGGVGGEGGGGHALVEVDPAVGEFSEGSLLLELCLGGSGLVLFFKSYR